MWTKIKKVTALVLALIVISSFSAFAVDGSLTVDGDYTYGDVTGNGHVNLIDAAHVLLAALHIVQLKGERDLIADFNNNGMVDTQDACFIAQYWWNNTVAGIKAIFA